MTARIRQVVASVLLGTAVVGIKVGLRIAARSGDDSVAVASAAPVSTSAATETPAAAPSAAPVTTPTPAASGGDSATAPTVTTRAMAATAAAPGDGGGKSVRVTVDASGAEPSTRELTFVRESYSYAAAGRRDPFVSLMTNGELRPMISDLRLVAVAYDPSGRGSVAIMRDLGTSEQYRVRTGQTLGRMRVARIQQKQVLFTIEEFGFSRQEVLALGDSTTARTK